MISILFCFLSLLVQISQAVPTPHQPIIGWYVNHDLKLWELVDKSRITHLFFSDRHVELNNEQCYVGLRKIDESGGYNEDYAMPRLIKYREEYNFKIILMLGGWGGSNFFGHCAHESMRSKFVDNLVDYLDKYDFDGVDLDWEHVGIGGACDFDKVFETKKDGCFMTAAEIKEKRKNERWILHHENDWENFLALINELRKRFDRISEKKGRRLLITSAVSVSGQIEGCQGRVDGSVYENNPQIFHHVPCQYPDWRAICEGLDYLNVMVYDIWGPWATYSGNHAPFQCDRDEPLMNIVSPPFREPCKPRFTVKNAISWFINPYEPEGGHQYDGGCPAEKILLGMPLYGKSFCQTDGLYKKGEPCDGKDQNIGPIWPSIKDIMSHGYYINTAQYFHNATKDGRLIASYYYNPETKHFVTYDSPELIYEKTKWSAQVGIGGYFFWSAEMDYEHLAAENAVAGWYAGKGKPLPDRINLDGETFISSFSSVVAIMCFTIVLTFFIAMNLVHRSRTQPLHDQ